MTGEPTGRGARVEGGERPPRPRRRLRVLGGAAIIGAVIFIAGFGRFVAAIETAEREPVRHADGIVALTGGAERVSDAVALLAQGHADRLLITGVNLSTTPEELARRMPSARELVDCCIDLGYRAVNTVGNARETAAWVRAHSLRSLIVVTSNYHMPRALAEMAFQLPGVDLQAYPVVSDRTHIDRWWNSADVARLVLGEYVKFLAVKTRQAILPPAFEPDDFHVARRGT